MKTPVILGSLLLLALLVSPEGHSAHHRPRYTCLVPGHAARLQPPHIVRTPAVARQHRRVRAVR
jgi:hypothetical protein